jgi:hypothetical protein
LGSRTRQAETKMANMGVLPLSRPYEPERS